MNYDDYGAARFRVLLRSPWSIPLFGPAKHSAASFRPIRLSAALAVLAASACVGSRAPHSADWARDNADCNAISLNGSPVPDALAAPFRSRAGGESVGAGAGAMIASSVSRRRNYRSCMRQRGHED